MRIGFCSFRLGDADGVSIETEKWRAACAALGHDSYRVAGHIPDGTAEADDVILPGLAYPAPDTAPERDALEAALGPADVVVVENIFGLPLNVAASRVLADVLAGRRVIGHHHDLPSQRPQWRNLDAGIATLFPPDTPGWSHVVINDLSRKELAARGIDSTVVRNTFDPDPAPGPRALELRSRVGADADTVVAVQPTRIIARKNVGLSIAGCERLAEHSGRDVVLVITGPVEDGYATAFASLRDAASVSVAHVPELFGGTGAFTMADAYTAADVVVFPSDWEGFGNPVMESVAHGRPLVVTPYPVLRELLELGFRFPLLHPDAIDSSVVAILDTDARAAELAHNHEILRRQLSPETLRTQLAELLAIQT